jgi:hypothetical protein
VFWVGLAAETLGTKRGVGWGAAGLAFCFASFEFSYPAVLSFFFFLNALIVWVAHAVSAL